MALNIAIQCWCVGANNLIPMEIALKIAEKIRANERFAAYIVIPMWPEGVPTGAATQRILYWQVFPSKNLWRGCLSQNLPYISQIRNHKTK